MDRENYNLFLGIFLGMLMKFFLLTKFFEEKPDNNISKIYFYEFPS